MIRLNLFEKNIRKNYHSTLNVEESFITIRKQVSESPEHAKNNLDSSPSDRFNKTDTESF